MQEIEIAKSQTLYQLERELCELVELRGELIQNSEPLDAVNGQIKAYVQARLKKVDGVASFIRYRRSGAAEARAEAKRLSSLADSWERDEEYLLGLVKDLMIEFKETKLEGRYGYLKLQANGGNQTLDIYNKELLPEEFVSYSVNIPSFIWSQILTLVANHGSRELEKDFEGLHVERVPKPAAIRTALAEKCCICAGEGGYDEQGDDRSTPCPACQVTGSAAAVPGARLEPRGKHVRIK